MIDVAILGGGFMGSTHAAAYKTLADRARVTVVYSRSPEKAAKVAEVVGAEPTADLAAAIETSEADVVDVCLPTSLHREAAERALAAGKHVILEKPIALTVEDAEAISRAAERADRLVMVALVLRFWPEYVELERRMRARELGEPLAVSCYRLSPPADWNDWIRDPSLSGGPCVDLLIHDFDQMNWLLGKPRRVFARAVAGEHVHAVVEYEAGQGIAEGSMAMPASYPFSSNIRVLCERGVAEYPFRAGIVEGEGNIGEIDAGAPGLTLYPAGGQPQRVAVEAADGWAAELAHFVESVEAGRAPVQGTAEQATDALKVSLAANRSIESGRPEDV